MNYLRLCIVTMSVILGNKAWAELDPELAQLSASSKNDGGPYLGGGMMFGQSSAAGRSRAGTAVLFGLEGGYLIPRGSWSRLEVGFELDTGSMEFTQKSSPKAKEELKVPMLLLGKFGYGYSIGGFAMGVLSAGVGTFSADLSSKADGNTSKADGVSGLAARLGVELNAPVSDMVDLSGGLRLTHLQFDVDEFKVNGTATSADESFNVNMTALFIGARVKF